jgi:hypothetical protein
MKEDPEICWYRWRNSGGVWLGANGGGFWLGRRRREAEPEPEPPFSWLGRRRREAEPEPFFSWLTDKEQPESDVTVSKTDPIK